MTKQKWDFRDVSLGLKILRDILLGRAHNLRQRFPPNIAPRSVPAPEIPRGPVYKYSNQWYCNRNAYDSVNPPVVAPIAEGPPINKDPFKKTESGGISPDAVCFNFAPTPGDSWWWDGHCYYELVSDPKPPPPAKKASKDPCPPSPPCPPCPPCPSPPEKKPKPKC